LDLREGSGKEEKTSKCQIGSDFSEWESYVIKNAWVESGKSKERKRKPSEESVDMKLQISSCRGREGRGKKGAAT